MTGVRTVSALSCAIAMVLASSAYAQQQTGTPGSNDIKPAQAASPGAHPLGNQNNGQTADQGRNRMNQSGTQQATYETRDQSTSGDDQNLDRVLGACLLSANKGEVEIGKLAQQRATDRDVKAFAEQMVKEHSKQVETLQQFVGSQQPTDRRSQIDKQIAERCTSDLKKELESKSGKDFDACYLGSQIGGHMHMSAALAVISSEASGELQKIAKDAQPTVDKHLDQAKKLMDQLDKSNDRRQASNQGSQSER
jgi:putative membrane protein